MYFIATILIAIATLFCGPNVHAQSIGTDSTIQKLDPWRNVGNYIIPRGAYIPSSTQYCLGGDCRTEWPESVSTTPGGSNMEVQVNENGAFAGYPTFTFNSSTGLLITPSISSTNALFINASSTNLFASALTFTTANGTSITSTNAFFTNLASTNFSVTNITATSITTTNANITNLTAGTAVVTSITSTNLFATNITFTNASGTNLTSTNGYLSRLLVGNAGSLGSAYFKVITDATAADAFILTDATNYTYDCGFDSTTGGAYCGGLAGTGWSLWANGAMVMRLTTGGKVGIGTAAPTAKLSVVGDFDVSATTTLNATTTINGPLTFATALGTSITTTNAFFTNLTATTLNLTNLVATNMTSTNGNISALTFTTASGTAITSTNAFFSSLVITNASTTNFYIAGILRDSTGSAGNFGDVLISTSTGNRWTNLGVACTPGSGDCTVVDNPSWFIVSGGAGCAENSIIIKDDSTYSCDPDFKWNRTDYATKRLEINGDISFLNATGTIGYFSESVSTTNIYADSITTNNITINNDITVNNLIALESVTVAASTTITDAGVLTNAAIVKEYPANREGEFLTNVLTDPPSIVINTAVANTQAFYSDDLSRMLVCSNVTSTGAISLKNGTLTPVNTGNTAFYNNAGTLQTITANTLCGGATYAVRGCITTNGFHAVMCVATSTSPTVFVKVTTSSYTNNIANASNWRTANFTVATPTPSVIGMVGISRATGSNTRYLQFVSSTTKVVPATFDFTVNPPTITPDNTLTCTTGGSATIQNTRAYEGGLVVGNAGAPFVTVYSGCGGSTVNGSYGASAPSLTGPDLFVTRCSVYSLNGQSLFRQYGYNGCEKPEF